MGGTSTLLTKSKEILKEVQDKIEIPLKFIHVIRNPFDNFATALLRRYFHDSLNLTEILKSPVSINLVESLN